MRLLFLAVLRPHTGNAVTAGRLRYVAGTRASLAWGCRAGPGAGAARAQTAGSWAQVPARGLAALIPAARCLVWLL